jgi:hypothetical protein
MILLDLGNLTSLSRRRWKKRFRKEIYYTGRGGKASFRYKVYNGFGVRNILRGLRDQGVLAYHPVARQKRFETRIYVSRRYGKSSIRSAL